MPQRGANTRITQSIIFLHMFWQKNPLRWYYKQAKDVKTTTGSKQQVIYCNKPFSGLFGPDTETDPRKTVRP